MRNIFLSLFVLLLTVCMSFGQTTDTAFKKQWIEIDSLITQKDLPKTALPKVEAIYKAAVKRKLAAQSVKALLYQLSLRDKAKDQDIIQKVAQVKKAITVSTNAVEQSILYTLLAETYSNYYDQHRWNLYNRKQTDEPSKEITAWNSNDFHKAITEAFFAALKQTSLLQQTGLKEYTPVLLKGNTSQLRPTLFDIIAHHALDYFKENDQNLTKPEEEFNITQTQALAPIAEFISYSFASKDSGNHQLIALKLFQQLIAFHSNDKDPSALIDNNIERISWVNEHAVLTQKETLYEAALKEITTKYEDNATAAQAWYLLAKIHADKARSYQTDNDTANRYEYVEALKIINQRVNHYQPQNEGSANMQSLLNEIKQQQLHTQAENVNVPGQPFRVLVSYKNVDTLYWRIIAQKDAGKIRVSRWDTKYWQKMAKTAFIKSAVQPLPATNDYQQHSVEIKIDALLPGKYVLFGSSSKNFNDSTDRLLVQSFDVSGITYLKSDNNYFVLDRESGAPIKQATVKYNITGWQNNKNITRKGTLKSDNNGLVTIPRSDLFNGSSADIAIYTANDSLNPDNRDYIYSSYSNADEADADDDDIQSAEEKAAHIYFFTDRSIYRPGQTVYFKGLAVTRNHKTGEPKLFAAKDSIVVWLKDADDEEVDSLLFLPNAYGSFTGKFKLPENVLTGEFSLEAEDFNSDTKFSVEEYKRPKFYTAFDTLKGSYRLNDTIHVTGYAKAFAGNAIGGAAVKFNVQRNARFPYTWLSWRRPGRSSAEKQITNGTVTTTEDGRFDISFPATPDSTVDKQSEPVFDFSIEASVTDINGETRELQTTLSLSYKSFVLQLEVPAVADNAALKTIGIQTKNFASVNVPANVAVRVYPLQVPATLYRKRYWQQPDVFVMNESEFHRNFPHDEYKEETDESKWPKSSAVITDTFNTVQEKSYALPAAPLPQGWYAIEAIAKDKDGSEIKDIKYIQVYDVNATALPSPQSNFQRQVVQTVHPGEQAKLLVGSSLQKVFLIQQTNRKQAGKNISDYKYVSLNNEKKEFALDITETDRGGVGFYYAYVKYNRVYTNGMFVIVPYDNKELLVNVSSFRNKTAPGSKEQWSVKISGAKAENKTAELLTAMYDASLDKLKMHRWDAPPLWDIRYTTNPWQHGANFFAAGSQENSIDQKAIQYNKRYDMLATSGDQLWWRNYNMHLYEDYLKEHKLSYDSTIAEDLFLASHKQRGDFLMNLQGRVAGLAMEATPELNDVVVVGYGTKKGLAATSSIVIRGASSMAPSPRALVVIDGVVTDKPLSDFDKDDIASLSVLNGDAATQLYGSKAANGVILISTKAGAQKTPPEVQLRKNFDETAFFFPQLYADTSGNYTFSFTMPEALTQWKWMSFAHTKDLSFGMQEQTITTQKTLMLQPNLPRFLREGDKIELVTKISNLSDSELTGQASLQLVDALNGEPVDGLLQNVFPDQYFTVSANGSTSLKFPVSMPYHFTKPLAVRLIAKAGNYSDGEENTLPVLTNRMLVTETLPMFMNGAATRQFSFDKLKDNKSETLQTESLTIEYTANPVWTAVQALPYLMEFPYECAEQTFNRFYANALAAYIVKQHPRIKQVFEKWSKDSTALQSNLNKNPELKQVLLQETPWVLQARNEREQKKNIALLFDIVKMSSSALSNLQKLKELQTDNGGFGWFKGSDNDRYITQYILTGFGKLLKLKAIPDNCTSLVEEMVRDGLRSADNAAKKDYDDLRKSKAVLTENHLSNFFIQYAYMRSFYADKVKDISPELLRFCLSQSEKYWVQQSSPYLRGMMALTLHRLLPLPNSKKFKNTAADILQSVNENMVETKEGALYIKNNNSGYYWYQSPIETQSLVIYAFDEVMHDQGTVGRMQNWLLLNKQTNNWRTTKATADACYALLFNNNLDVERKATITLGSHNVSTNNDEKGYLKQRIAGNEVTASMGNITVTTTASFNNAKTKQADTIATSYGAVYWQYFEDLDKITAVSSPLSITKQLMIEQNTGNGKVLMPVAENQDLHVGDKVSVHLILKTDRDMEYIHLKDMRAASMEPVNVLSGYKWQDNLGYYEATKDASTNFFISHLRKGTYVFDYPLYITHTGTFSAGIASVQCMYAPEFSSHSEGIKINVAAAAK